MWKGWWWCVDDTLVFCEVSQEKILYLSLSFMWFEVIWSLRINLGKNELVPMGNVPNVEELVAELGWTHRYVFGSSSWCFKSRVSWPFVEGRVHKRLAIEKCNIFLRKGRGPTRIKNTLSSLPIYHMSLLFPREFFFSFNFFSLISFPQTFCESNIVWMYFRLQI